jgi:hypothetical protein
MDNEVIVKSKEAIDKLCKDTKLYNRKTLTKLLGKYGCKYPQVMINELTQEGFLKRLEKESELALRVIASNRYSKNSVIYKFMSEVPIETVEKILVNITPAIDMWKKANEEKKNNIKPLLTSMSAELKDSMPTERLKTNVLFKSTEAKISSKSEDGVTSAEVLGKFSDIDLVNELRRRNVDVTAKKVITIDM